MPKELELWQFIASHLKNGERVMLLVVAESSGSSPGRAGYKMAVAANGELFGSIGGGVMEVSLAELAKGKIQRANGKIETEIIEQVHQKSSPNSSGMLCSGRQIVILQRLDTNDLDAVEVLIGDLEKGENPWLVISEVEFKTAPDRIEPQNCPLPVFERVDDIFTFADKLDRKNILYIIGGGHCALALSELMSHLGFSIRIFDDRPALNTIAKNHYADQITILEDYDQIDGLIPNFDDIYVVVMTLGYKFDESVIRSLFEHTFKYFGVLGSKAKMKTLLTTLENEGFNREKLARIRTPIGLPINSRTPEEIAVSIAAEIIQIKNG